MTPWNLSRLPIPELALICPRCHGPLGNAEPLLCDGCGAQYGVADGVPILVADDLNRQQLGQREYFDAEFAGYDRYAVDNWRRSYIKRIFDATGVLDGGEPYLDVGVGGSGATVIEAARSGVTAFGCDLSVPGVLAARRFAEKQGVLDQTAWLVCAAEALPFEDSSIGSASAVAVLEHLDDDSSAVSELARVLKPGGRVWFTVPHAFRYMPPPVWPVYWWHDRRIGHKRHYEEASLVRLCTQAGLEHVETFFSAHPVKLLQSAATALFPALRRPDSRLWWKLERLDWRAAGRPLGAVHLSAVFRRVS
jgi:ubiquinone/menaquinone biosynthesis C-methylase UbiE